MISVERFKPEDEALIRAFNQRIAGNDNGFQLPETLRGLSAPGTSESPIWTDLWIASDGSSVRGGFLLKHERLLTGNLELRVGNYQLPLSEGIIDRRYATVGLSLTQRALSECPALYSLGMGSLSRPLPRVLGRFGWKVEEVPFFFRVLNGAQFARNIRALQQSPLRHLALRAIAASGVATIGALGWRAAARLAAAQFHRSATKLLTVGSFDERVDKIQRDYRGSFGALLDRGSAALNLKFPVSDERLHRFMVHENGRDIGWVILTINDVRNHRQFGDIRLGCLVDGMIEPNSLATAIALACRQLLKAGASLIVSNQSHKDWQRALRKNLFMTGPSNFILARSRAFAPEVSLSDLHINRGDGDGPINL